MTYMISPYSGSARRAEEARPTSPTLRQHAEERGTTMESDSKSRDTATESQLGGGACAPHRPHPKSTPREQEQHESVGSKHNILQCIS